jgi:ProP effector
VSARNGADPDNAESAAGPEPDQFLGGNDDLVLAEHPHSPQAARAIQNDAVQSAQQTLEALAELYPACFAADKSKPHRPLKIGIHRDLVDRGILRPNECRPVLRSYAARRQYQKALAAGGQRFDLDGTPTGEVAPEEIEEARRVLARINARLAERKRAGKAKPDPKAPASALAAPRRLGLTDLRRAAAARRKSRGRS